MVRIILEIPEDESERFARQAEREGKTLDAWLISTARQRIPPPKTPEPERFKSVEELRAFFREINARSGPGPEPDWEEHLMNIDESRRQGLPEV